MKKYPLEQLAFVKQKKLEEAEKVLREKKAILIEEETKLRAVELERDQVLEHKKAKLKQMREALDEGAPSHKIEQMRLYLKLVKEDLQAKEKKVEDQKKKVKDAEQNVEKARLNLQEKQKNVEKLARHQKEWQKEMKKEAERKEEGIADEMGSAKYIIKKKRSPHG
jgi:chromosome segregation ATPase